MTGLTNATPAPGSNAPMPTPTAAPVTEAAPVVAPVAKPADVVTAAALPTSAVNAQSSTSDAAQVALAAEATPAVEAPAAAEPVEPTAKPAFDTGNKAFDQVASLLADKNVPGYSGILLEAASGEISLSSKAALAEALGGPVAELVLNQLQSEMTSQQEAGTKEGDRLKLKVVEAFGYSPEQADETWTALQNFARSPESGLTPTDLEALDEMLTKGGVQGDMAINDMVSRYEKSQGFTRVPNLMQGDGKTQSGFKPMSKTDYQTSMREAQNTFGEGSREVDALRQQRTVSIQRGYI
jgi:hypothetical protein